MLHIGFFCRGKCSAETLHGILDFTEIHPLMNYAKLKCVKCDEQPFVVEYPKGTQAPTNLSRRIGHELSTDEQQPTDLCAHC